MTPTPDSEQAISALIATVARLRSPDGCPWDLKQTHSSLRAALIEEAYETVDAIDAGDTANLREELGDLLLQVLLHAQIASESEGFSFADIAADLNAKLIRRHPHVFGDKVAADAEDVIHLWEQVKSEEKGDRTSALDGVPTSLPALMRAQKTGKKAARTGFDWDNAEQIIDKIREETDEMTEALQHGHTRQVEEEIGDLLFAITNLTRMKKLEAELLLNQATAKFTRRFQHMEAHLAANGRNIENLPMTELNTLWELAKTETSAPERLT